MISHEESKAAIGIDGRGWATSSLIRIQALSDRREWKRGHPIHHFYACAIIFLMVLGNRGDVIAIYIAWWSHLNICLVRLPMLGVAFAGLSLAGKLAVIGLGIWTYSHFFLEGCYRAIGKFIGNILPGFASLRSAKDLSTAMALLFTGTAKDIYQSFIEGC